MNVGVIGNADDQERVFFQGIREMMTSSPDAGVIVIDSIDAKELVALSPKIPLEFCKEDLGDLFPGKPKTDLEKRLQRQAFKAIQKSHSRRSK
jgi:hypothetical protein